MVSGRGMGGDLVLVQGGKGWVKGLAKEERWGVHPGRWGCQLAVLLDR